MFRQEVKISSLFTDELFTAKVPVFFYQAKSCAQPLEIWVKSIQSFY